jgi:hypothetical protein
MLYREIIAVCSEIHTKHINTLCGQNVELLNVEPGGTYSNQTRVRMKILSSRTQLQRVKTYCMWCATKNRQQTL